MELNREKLCDFMKNIDNDINEKKTRHTKSNNIEKNKRYIGISCRKKDGWDKY